MRAVVLNIVHYLHPRINIIDCEGTTQIDDERIKSAVAEGLRTITLVELAELPRPDICTATWTVGSGTSGKRP